MSNRKPKKSASHKDAAADFYGVCPHIFEIQVPAQIRSPATAVAPSDFPRRYETVPSGNNASDNRKNCGN